MRLTRASAAEACAAKPACAVSALLTHCLLTRTAKTTREA
jgi:hypothetical protein